MHITDIYLDRYLPSTILKIIYDNVNDSIEDYNCRKDFC